LSAGQARALILRRSAGCSSSAKRNWALNLTRGPSTWKKLGFKPYPGTLNLEISEEFLPAIEFLDLEKGIGLISPDPKFCNAMVFKVSLLDITGAVILPEEKVRVHPKNIIEIIAPQNIKASLNVKNGDSVTVVFNR
jgi:CTP-dependent riboflavin kinase